MFLALSQSSLSCFTDTYPVCFTRKQKGNMRKLKDLNADCRFKQFRILDQPLVIYLCLTFPTVLQPTPASVQLYNGAQNAPPPPPPRSSNHGEAVIGPVQSQFLSAVGSAKLQLCKTQNRNNPRCRQPSLPL